jgi:hypothetical protein
MMGAAERKPSLADHDRDPELAGEDCRKGVMPFGPQLRKVLALTDIGLGVAQVIHLEGFAETAAAPWSVFSCRRHWKSRP